MAVPFAIYCRLVRTDYIDSVTVDSISQDQLIYFKISSFGSNYQLRYRIDRWGNLYSRDYQPEYPRYKLAADSGASWFVGFDADTNYQFRISVRRIFQSIVFGIPTTVKVFRFERIYVPTQYVFWLGNDYLGDGFGMIRTDIEPSDVYILTGAIIDTMHYGTILSASENKTFPAESRLLQNYPNPFNPATTIGYDIPRSSYVKLEIFNILGQHIETIVDQMQEAGSYQIQFNASHLPSGVFFYRLTAGRTIVTKRMLLLR